MIDTVVPKNSSKQSGNRYLALTLYIYYTKGRSGSCDLSRRE